MTIRRKFHLLFFINIFIVLAIGMYGASTYHDAMQNEAEILSQSANNASLAMRTQLHYKKQSQEWKNLLLRGQDTNSYKYYEERFFQEEENVRESVSKLLNNLHKNPQAHGIARAFLKSHEILGLRYREALPVYRLTDNTPHIITDKYLLGVDTKPTDLLNDLVNAIAQAREQTLVETKQQLIQKETIIVAVASLAIILVLLFFHLFITKRIISPIKELKEAALNITQGEYGNPVSIVGNDEMASLGLSFNRIGEKLSEYSAYMENSLKEVTQLAEDLDDAKITIQKKEIRIRAILDSMSDAVVTVTSDGKIDSANPAAENMFAYSQQYLLGKGISTIFPKNICQSFSEALMPHKLETQVINKEQSDLSVEVAINKFILGEQCMYVCVIRDIEQRKLAEKQLIELANYDPLTRLPNRHYFQKRLKKTLLEATRKKYLTALLFVDLDNFKKINDTLGHTYGDNLLSQFSSRLQSSIRHCDTVARWGGDEFILLLENVGSRADVIVMAKNILESMSDRFDLSGHEIFSSASIGISIYDVKEDNAESMLREADIAMHHAKDAGKNQYKFYSPSMNARGFELLQLETRLRQAMWNKEFSVYYQPQLDIKTNRIIGAEGLARWNHPERGLVSPLDFIPLLEETGLIIPVGEYLLEIACRQAVQWQKNGHPDFRISINLSARQFDDQHLASKVHRILEETGLAPHHLELEITESAIMTDADKTKKILDTLNDMGIDIAIDDFGTGYSSLSYLRKYPISTLKIDRMFVKELESQADDRAISQTIINMANNLRMGVIAEGVETADQLSILEAQGCDIIQGFYISKPLPCAEFSAFLSKGSWEKVA